MLSIKFAINRFA